MFLEDFKNDFYMKIKGKRILILVNYDVDAICACKILQSLFSTDGLLYSVVPVDLIQDLQAAFHERRDDETHVLLINCGGTLDLVELLEPADDVQIYVLDTHRPLHVCNVYSSSQVRILGQPDDAGAVPAFDDIFKDDSDNEASEGEEDIEARIEKRRERKAWEQNRDEVMFEYVQYSYYSRSSSATAFDLAWKLSKDNFDLLWYAVVGVSEQLLMNKVDESSYLTECGALQQHISRLLHRGAAAPEDRGVAVNIEFEHQLKLAMYRHWTVELSMMNSVVPATSLKLWTFDGVKRLHEMLAEIGIPLNQCRQRFTAMQSLYRQDLQKSIVETGPRYGLDEMTIASFTLQAGYRGAVGAMDVVHSLVGLLLADKSKTERFLDALEALSRNRRERLDVGMELCQKLLTAIFRQAQVALEIGLLRNAGPFFYLAIQEESPHFAHPYGIALLAEFALKAFSGTRRGKRTLPLLVSTPCGTDESGETLCHVAAIAPLAEESNKTFFGQAFEKASEQSQTKIIARYFDSSVIQIRLQDRTKFFDAMVVLLS